MNKKFDEEVKKKLREDVDVPECVDEGIKRAYDMIGISGETKGNTAKKENLAGSCGSCRVDSRDFHYSSSSELLSESSSGRRGTGSEILY